VKQAIHTIQVDTNGQALHDITRSIRAWVAQQAINTGLLTLWCRHTSASLIVQENADPDVIPDDACVDRYAHRFGRRRRAKPRV
jgi:secondary thiamine-phosphate synthase enzyme